MFVLNSLNTGGSERKTLRVANGLSRDGWDVHVCYLNPPHDLGSELDSGIECFCLNRSGKLDIKAVKRLRAYLLERNINRVWAVNLYPALYVFLAMLGRRDAAKAWVFVNTTEFHSRKERFQMLLYAPVLRASHGVVFGCEMQRRYWSKIYRIAKSKASVIYNGVDPDYFSPEGYEAGRVNVRRQFGFSPDDIVFGNVAMFRPEKGHDYLIDSIQRLHAENPLVRLLLVGDGPLLPAMKEKVASLGLNDVVVFSGRHSDVRPMLSVMDAFLLVSVAVETFSNAVLEAMSMKLPVILSDIGGASEMLGEDGGLLFKPGDGNALEGAMRYYFEPANREAFGISARERVEERFTERSMLDCYKHTMCCAD